MVPPQFPCLVPSLELLQAEGFLTLCILGLLLLGLWEGHRPPFPMLHTRVLRGGATLLLVTAFMLWASPPLQGPVLDHRLVMDLPATHAKLGVLVFTASFLLLSEHWWHRVRCQHWESTILVLTMTLALLLLVSVQDVLVMYLALELLSLCSYLFAALAGEDDYAAEGALKYFLLGAFSAGLLTLGCALLYGATGTTNFLDMTLCLTAQPLAPIAHTLALVGFAGLLMGLLFKLAAAPFHQWAPDVYTGLPLPVTAYLLTVPKVGLVVLLLRLLHGPGAALLGTWQSLLVFSSFLSLWVGALGGLREPLIKRLLAYSSIGHGGLFVAALACGTPEGLQACALYLVLYVVTGLLLLGSLLSVHPTPRTLQDLQGLGRRGEALSGVMALGIFSLAGLPPLVGFLGKVTIFTALLETQSLQPLLWMALATSAISCFYYLRVVRSLYFQPPVVEEPLEPSSPVSVDAEGARVPALVVLYVSVLVLLLGFWSSPVLTGLAQQWSLTLLL
jgi:NADH-quinone oxidoreductase subunit N